VESGRLVGLVTERDVLKAVAATLPAIKGLDPDTYFW
jgi:CBS domain-containing protein